MERCDLTYAVGPKRGQPIAGTVTGYWRHYRAAEVPCDACATAIREYNRESGKKRNERIQAKRRAAGL